MGRGAVRMVFNPRHTLWGAYSLCKKIVNSLSSDTCGVVGLETGIRSSPKKSSSSVSASSSASVASEEAAELIDHVLHPDARELMSETDMHLM